MYYDSRCESAVLYLLKMSVIRNQRGSVLLMVFTVSVVFAFMLPSIYFLILNSVSSQARRGDLEAYEMFIQSVRTTLEDPLSCHDYLGGVGVPTAVGHKRGLDIPRIKMTYGDTEARKQGHLKPGWRLPGTNLEIRNIRIVRSGPNSGDVRIKTSRGLNDYKMAPFRIFIYMIDHTMKKNKELSVNLRESPTAPLVAPEILRPLMRKGLMIRLFANLNDSEKIFNCFGFESFAAACQNMGGAYNHLHKSPDLKCQPDKQCFTGRGGLVSNPNACGRLGSIPYRAQFMGVVDGKKVYTCTLCREDL